MWYLYWFPVVNLQLPDAHGIWVGWAGRVKIEGLNLSQDWVESQLVGI